MPEDVVRGVRHALGRPAGLQDRRHLRGRVRRARRRTTTRPTTRRPRSRRASEPAVIILGSGPNRIGQGIEFDYSCVHASLRAARRRLRDRDGQLQPRDRLHRLRHLRPALLRAAHPRGRARGRPRRAAGRPGRRRHRASSAGRPRSAWRRALEDAGVPIVGTIARGDPPRRGPRRLRPGARRGRPAGARSTARRQSFDEARRDRRARSATRCWCARPTCSAAAAWRSSTTTSTLRDLHRRGPPSVSPEHPVLVDRFLDDAIEIDVDALYDGDGAVPRRRHGAHRGGRHPLRRLGLRAAADHARAPTRSTGSASRTEAIARGRRRARAAQRPVRAGRRRALRARGQPAGRRARCRSSPRRPACRWPRPRPGSCSARRSPSCARRACCPPTGDGGTLPADAPIAVKEAVLPFNRFRTREGQVVDTVLGPEMRSTGEVMGIDADFGTAFAKCADRGLRRRCRPTGTVFVSVANRDKRAMIFPVKRLADLGFEILATEGTAEVLRRNGVDGHGRPQAQRGRGPGRRADHRRARSSPARSTWSSTRRPASRRRGPTATRSAPPRPARTAVHHHGAGARRRGAGHRGAACRGDRRRVAAGPRRATWTCPRGTGASS